MPRYRAEQCTLSSIRLVEIAEAASDAFCASVMCEFRVMEHERDYWCAVQVWPKENQFPGAFETIVISNKEKIIRRIGGA
jgi:hypothetical protein